MTARASRSERVRSAGGEWQNNEESTPPKKKKYRTMNRRSFAVGNRTDSGRTGR